jgi:hypothetical protein
LRKKIFEDLARNLSAVGHENSTPKRINSYPKEKCSALTAAVPKMDTSSAHKSQLYGDESVSKSTFSNLNLLKIEKCDSTGYLADQPVKSCEPAGKTKSRDIVIKLFFD